MVEIGIIQILAILVGGALGGMARFAVASWVERTVGGDFPWGTLAVNVSGSAVIGALAALLPQASTLALPWAFLVIGVLGSYTTVSSFSLQTLTLGRSGRHVAALGNVLASTGLCLAAATLAFLALAGAG
jgi:fluoride exporter